MISFTKYFVLGVFGATVSPFKSSHYKINVLWREIPLLLSSWRVSFFNIPHDLFITTPSNLTEIYFLSAPALSVNADSCKILQPIYCKGVSWHML